MRIALPVIAATILAASPGASADSLEDLVRAAKAEGQLTVIGVTRDWCGNAARLDNFKAKFGIPIVELNPEAVSGEIIEAVRANKNNTGPQAPDVVEVGQSFGALAKAEDLLQPYKVATWDSIPEKVKDADAYWYGAYYGVLVFEANKDVIKHPPTDWSDLSRPVFKNSVALSGDPRASFNAIQAVYASGLSLTAGDTARAAEAGLSFFAELVRTGNFVPAVGNAASLALGTTPLIVRLDFLALADRDRLDHNPAVEVVVPKSGLVAVSFVDAISAHAPHPNAAKLWMEYLYSDEAQLIWLEGYCHPVRYDDLAKRNKIPAELLHRLLPAEDYRNIHFPTPDQQKISVDVISKRWQSVVVDAKK
jgi:putative spermidine/putrescine transport system substrate-binding protein